MIRCLFSVCLWSAICCAHAAILEGRIVGVADGDTVTLLDSKNQQHRIRIAGIDAPEKGQAFGNRPQQNLSRMSHRNDATAQCHKIDQYGRPVCKVWVQPNDCPRCGKTLDVGMAQIIAGMAWWYRQYANEQSAEDRGRYESSEDEARLRKRGLWVDQDPAPPWVWRRDNGNKNKTYDQKQF